MVLAIEPMVTAGPPCRPDGRRPLGHLRQDGSLAAHFEFTVAVTAAGPAHPHARGIEDRGRAAAAPLGAVLTDPSRSSAAIWLRTRPSLDV
jgi:methionyl aminopeptidase